MMDSFFNGEFFSYGTRVLGYSEVPQEDRYVGIAGLKCILLIRKARVFMV